MWTVRTDFTEEPVRLVVDTGSQVDLAATDSIKPFAKIRKPIYQLGGFSGQEPGVSTDGHLIGNFITDHNMKWLTRIHLIDRRNAGLHDGYVGYDFMKDHRAKIDLHDKTLELFAP